MEVEDEEQPRALVREHLVDLVLERDVRRLGAQPVVLLLGVVHRLVELVQVLVPQELVVDDVPLPAGVLE